MKKPSKIKKKSDKKFWKVAITGIVIALFLSVALVSYFLNGVEEAQAQGVQIQPIGFRMEQEINSAGRKPKIDVAGMNVHVVFLLDAGGQICYIRSIDGGINWDDGLGNPGGTRVLATGSFDFPDVAVGDINGVAYDVHVVYVGLSGFIYYTMSTDNGATWLPLPIPISPVSSCDHPVIATHDNIVYVAYEYSSEIYFIWSPNAGVNWYDDRGVPNQHTKISTTTAYDPAISADIGVNNLVAIVWEQVAPTTFYEIYYRLGRTYIGPPFNRVDFSLAPMMVSNDGVSDSVDSLDPDVGIMQNGDYSHVVWADDRYPGMSVTYYNKIINYPYTPPSAQILGEIQLVSRPSGSPAIKANGCNYNDVHVVWVDDHYGSKSQIWYKASNDNGESFLPAQPLTLNIKDNIVPDVAVD
ncbi:MAG: hypothetical protein KAJ51_04915, partial [Thermoplasmata archaeon]|nr:hypothetical protein [Thermoplasmata archaeon]